MLYQNLVSVVIVSTLSFFGLISTHLLGNWLGLVTCEFYICWDAYHKPFQYEVH